MELIQFIKLLWRWSWLIVFCGVVAGGAGYLIRERQIPVYRSSTTLLAIPGRPSREAASDLDAQTYDGLVRTYKEMLLKRPVLESVITNLQLTMSVRDLIDKMSVDIIRDTQLIVVTVEDADPQQAAHIANEVVRVFSQQEATLLANPYALNRPGLHIVESAEPPVEPFGRSHLHVTLLAAIIGMMFSLGIVFMLEYTDTAIRSSADVTQLTGLSTLATIGTIRGSRKLVTLSDPHSPVAEMYRMVRAQLEFAATDNPVQSIVVTSSHAHEGKSTTVANLAVALAQTGLRVILVDANLRRPTLHHIFEQPDIDGFTTAIQQVNQRRSYEHMLAGGGEHLRLLLSGPVPSNPSVLLVPQRIRAFIAELEDDADVVLFDSPALLEVIDTTLLLQACDASLLVVRAGETRADALLQASEHLARSKTRTLGVILNRVARANSNRYGYAHHQQRSQDNLAGQPLVAEVLDHPGVTSVR